MLPKINPTQTKAWKGLNEYFAEKNFDLRELFAETPNRFEEFSIKRENFLFDFSKNLIITQLSRFFPSNQPQMPV